MVGELELAGGGIEGGEELVVGQHAGMGQQVEQGGFAGIGVADEREQGPAMPAASAAEFGAALADEQELGADAGDALLDAAPIEFELLFAGPLEADTAFLAFQMGPEAAQAGDEVVELGQFDLKAAFQREGALGEDVEDELGAVHDAHAQNFLEGASLCGGQVVVEDHESGLGGLEVGGDLLGLATADVGGRIQNPKAAEGFTGDFGLGGVGQRAQLAEGVVDFGAGLVA